MKKVVNLAFNFIFLLTLFQGQLFAQDTLYVDAGGFELRLLKKGSGTGPTVIMENGMNMKLERWFGLDDSLARRATVVSYDRAFLGKSGKGNPDRSGDVVAAELKLALQDADIKPPYIFIGFSLGGYYIKAFARANPDDTKGLLLIDPLNTEAFYSEFKTDFPDVYQWEAESYSPKEDDPNFNEVVFAFGDAFGEDGVPAYIPTILLIAKLPPPFPEKDIPDIPDLEEKNRAIQELWVQHLLQWAADYPLVKTIEVPDAGHCIHCFRMDVVLDAFNELMETINIPAVRH